MDPAKSIRPIIKEWVRMLNWRTVLMEEVLPKVAMDQLWTEKMHEIISDECSPLGLHLAIFVEPYLQYILNGKKTVESRFGLRRSIPYGKIVVGDVILLKRSGGPLLGICQVSQVWFYRLDPDSWGTLRKEFTQSLCAQDPSFWEKRQRASFATLMQLSSVRAIEPVLFPKQDRRGWVVLKPPLPEKGASSL
jgi:hypothetical protein